MIIDHDNNQVTFEADTTKNPHDKTVTVTKSEGDIGIWITLDDYIPHHFYMEGTVVQRATVFVDLIHEHPRIKLWTERDEEDYTHDVSMENAQCQD